MNQQAKSAIKSLVLDLRHTLEDEIAIQLKRYGFAGGRWRSLGELPHIERDDQAASDYFRLRAALEQHLRRIGADPDQASAEQRAEAVDWFVREVAFTHLNRLVALKCLEVRELTPEIITTRDAYGGRSRAHRDYRNAHPDQARRPDDALPAAIRHVCRQVHAEFKFLFDVGDPAIGQDPPTNAILWPSTPVLKACIGMINGLDEAADNTGRSLWTEDEIIGWIYQFYNVEQKEAIRDRGRPRRPAEVAVINQFFTPRWIVKFLVDNTLGRLWLEMHPDSKRVREKCDYLVPEPSDRANQRVSDRANERVSESASQRVSESAGEREGDFALDPDSPINNPQAEPRREPKRPQELRLIDPACGTMHFGHYAFEVFQAIYRDAIERGWAEPPEESIAAAILRHNLYGVDIDLRAVQLAGLSLFIKAKSADPDAHVSHLNLVVADAVLPADGARERFLAQYADDKTVQDAVRQVLEEMENVAEVGSLLRVEERLRDILGEAGHAAAMTNEEMTDDKLRQRGFGELAPEDWGAHYTVQRLMEDLREFAAEALQIHDLNAQLFAQEAEKTVHLLDVFLNDYDVVVMNPPFGKTTSNAKEYLNRSYRAFSNNNLLCVFVERALVDMASTGFTGAVLDRTFLLKMSYEAFRREILLSQGNLLTFTDLGWDVLDDASVEVCTAVISGKDDHSDAVFFRSPVDNYLISTGPPMKAMETHVVSMRDFITYPNASFAYWTPKSVRRVFREFPSLQPEAGSTREGLHPNDADRFLRNHWEVHTAQIGRGEAWAPVANGGGYSPFYRDNQTVILYENDAKAIRALRGMRNEHLQFKSGVTWGKRTDIISFQYLPKGHAFTSEGLCFFPKDKKLIWTFLSILNSALIRYTTNTLCGQHKLSGYIAQLPYSPPEARMGEQLGSWARQAHDLKASWNAGNEICTRFETPWLVQMYKWRMMNDEWGMGNGEWRIANGERRMPDDARRMTDDDATGIEQVLALLGDDAPKIALPEPVTLEDLLDAVCAVERAADARLQRLQGQIDEAVYELYEISEQDRRLIERELGDRPPELVWPQMEGKSNQEKRREHVRRLLSHFLLQALKEKRDGILPLSDGAGRTTALDEIRRRLAETFGEEAAFKMESEIKQVLGRDIEDWLDGPFIKWHVKLYKRCPVIWQLSSGDYYHTFNCFVYYHKLDADTLRKVQTLYLWPQRRALQSKLESARKDQQEGVSGASARVEDAEEDLEVLATFEEKLVRVIEGETPYQPPNWAEGPIRNGVYDPVLDDGVKVNIMPLQKARILRYKRLV